MTEAEQIEALRGKYAYLERAVEKYGVKRQALAAGNPFTREGGPDLSEEEIDIALLLLALKAAEQGVKVLKQYTANLERAGEGLADYHRPLNTSPRWQDALNAWDTTRKEKP